MIDQNLIFLDVNLKTQKEVFKFLAEKMVKQNYGTDVQGIYESLKKREQESTTGMMEGFAIPHGKSSAIIKPTIIVVKLKTAINWDSLDGKPTQYIISMFIPEQNSGKDHLKILSQVARMLMQEEFKEKFVQAENPEQLVNLISSKLNLSADK